MIKVFLNDSEVEILDVESLGLGITYSVSDMNDLGARKNAITKPFKLPLTKANRKVLGFTEDFNVADGMNQTQTITARIEDDGEVLIQGYYKIESALWSFMYDGVYEGVIIGDNGDWRVRIYNKYLNELDFSADNHTWNSTNILNSWPLNGNYVYPIINYGKFTNPLNIQVEEVYPATSVKTIVEKIFNEDGYTISSSFKDSDFFDRLYIPFTREYPKANQTTIELNSGFKSGLSSNKAIVFDEYTTIGSDIFELNSDSGNGMYDNGANYNTSTYIYTSTANIKGSFSFSLSLTYGASIVSPFGMAIQKSTDGGTTWSVIGWGSFTAALDGTTYQFSMNTGVIDINSGEKFRTSIENLTPPAYSGLTGTAYGTVNSLYTFFSLTFSDALIAGGTYDIALNLPEITCMQFIQALKHLFNLYFKTDVNTRTVYFEPRDNFYKSRANANWSNKLDLSKEVKIEFIGDEFSKIINYRYKEDGSDGYVKAFQDQQDLILAAHEETIDNQFAKEGKQDFANPIFAPTIMDTALEIGLISERIPKMWKDVPAVNEQPEWNTKYEPRILYYAGRTALAAGESYEIDGFKQTHYPNFYSCYQTASNDNSLFFDTTNFSYGLFEKYYLNEVKYYNESRIFTGYFHLNSSDVSQLDLRYPIHLSINGNESDFYVLEITDYNPSVSQPVKVTLLKKLGSDAQSTLSEDVTEELLPSTSIEVEPEEIGIIYTNAGGEFAQVYHTDITGNIVATNGELSAPSAGASHD